MKGGAFKKKVGIQGTVQTCDCASAMEDTVFEI